MASLETRGDSVRVVWRLGGGRQGARQSCTFRGGTPEAREKTADAARALVEARGHNVTRDEVYAAILGADGDVSDPGVPTFKQWAEMWIAERRQRRDAEPGTINKYESILMRRGVPFLGSMRLTDIDRETIKAYSAWISSSRVTLGRRNHRRGTDGLISPRTVKQNFSVVRQCLGAAVPKWLAVNPAVRPAGESRAASALPKVGKYEAAFLRPDEVAAIMRACRDDLYDMVLVAFRTGMRRGELVSLEARNVLLRRNGGVTVLVRTTVKPDGSVGPTKSEMSRRDIPVTGVAADVLRRRVQGKRPGDLVFPAPKGKRWCTPVLTRRWGQTIAEARRCPEHPPPPPPEYRPGMRRRQRNDVVSVCDCAGVLRRPVRLHDARHTHASVLIEQGWHAKKIQRRLGHSLFTTTMEVYGHLMDLGDERELDVAEDWFEQD
jgi:integrase